VEKELLGNALIIWLRKRRLVPGAKPPINPPKTPPTADSHRDDTESVELQMRQQCGQKRGKIKNKKGKKKMPSGNASSAGHAWCKQTRKMQNGCVNNLDELPAQPASVCIFLVYVSLKNTYSQTKRVEAEHNERQWEKRKMCHLPTAKQTHWRSRPMGHICI